MCTDYRGNGSYLNYTSNIDMLLLELNITDYIESNVTNELCREYIMVVVCATIYPVCRQDGVVQQLCSEECDTVISEDMCVEDVANVTAYVNELIGDPTIHFTINCSNTLEFAEQYLESSVCSDDDDCFSASMVGNSDNNTEGSATMPSDPPTNTTMNTTTTTASTTTMPTTQLSIPDMYVCR